MGLAFSVVIAERTLRIPADCPRKTLVQHISVVKSQKMLGYSRRGKGEKTSCLKPVLSAPQLEGTQGAKQS